jgi:SagB-type dehydrogenase family enzyme
LYDKNNKIWLGEEIMPQNIGEEFMEQTRYRYQSPSAQSQSLPRPPLELVPEPGQALVDLPDPKSLVVPLCDLRQLIEDRHSLRSYTEKALTLAELSYLLWCTQGVKEVTKHPITLRTVPSAGSRHAFETYLLVNRVEGLAPGIYRFLAIEHKLVVISLEPGLAEALTAACHKQGQVKHSAVTFVWVAVRERMAWRYGTRGYRYLHLDAGHVCQNLYLAAESIQCGVCAIAAYDDDELNHLLHIDGVELFAIYLAALGKKGSVS